MIWGLTHATRAREGWWEYLLALVVACWVKVTGLLLALVAARWVKVRARELRLGLVADDLETRRRVDASAMFVGYLSCFWTYCVFNIVRV